MNKPLETITLADVARQPRPGMVVPGSLAFTPDAKGVTYLFSAEGTLIRSLWCYDIATGKRRIEFYYGGTVSGSTVQDSGYPVGQIEFELTTP